MENVSIDTVCCNLRGRDRKPRIISFIFSLCIIFGFFLLCSLTSSETLAEYFPALLDGSNCIAADSYCIQFSIMIRVLFVLVIFFLINLFLSFCDVGKILCDSACERNWWPVKVFLVLGGCFYALYLPTSLFFDMLVVTVLSN